LDGPGAEGNLARHPGHVDPDARFEPLPPLVDEGDHGDRHVEEPGRKTGQAVEGRLGWGIEDVVPLQRAQPFALVALWQPEDHDCREYSDRWRD
jgi:hypothetical protein